MKKFLSLLLSCMLCLATLALPSCNNKGDENASTSSSSAQQETYLELKSSNESLTLGDRVELTVSYNEIEGEKPLWFSSKPDVVSVDENGVVEALKVGKAMVTVRYGEKEATCEIESGLSGNVPVLAFNNNIREEITLMKSSEYDFSSHIRFNGKTFLDGEIEYYVADESIATIVGGKLKTNQTVGSTIVSVAATWRGQTVHTKMVKINVIEDTTVLLNGGMLQSVELYTVEKHEGVEYTTSKTISSVSVLQDGVGITDYELFILDEGIATIEKVGSAWEIKASKAGKTNLIVSFEDKEIAFDVHVLRPVSESGITLDYSISDAKYFDEETQTLKAVTEAMEGFADVISYEFDRKEYKVKDGKLNIPEGKDVPITLYNDNVGYQIRFNVYTAIFDELEDFERIYAGTEQTEVTGEYMLAKDIIEPDTCVTMPEGKVPNDFAGTFDGKGHILSFSFSHGLKHRFGLFGRFLKGATIRNVAFHNVTTDGTTGKNSAGIICAESSQSAPVSILENIYVNLTFDESTTYAVNLPLMYNVANAVKMENVIIDVPTVPKAETYGSFARNRADSLKDCYIISTAKLYVAPDDPNSEKWTVSVPTRFESFSEMKSAGNDYSSFSAEFWDVTTYGVPVWKSLVEEFTF